VAYTYKHGDRPLEGITIQRAVGRGGFGEVYYALTDSGKQVALKYLRENPDIELRGIGHVMNLKSPHLITIYDVRRNQEGEPFVIMEYVSGPSLRDLLIAEPDGLTPQKAAFFLTGIGQGLIYLHERGIVHRDLKPANIFYDDGYVKIGDYGLSKHIAVSAHSANTISVGTVHYMAPEIGSGNYTKAIDTYALGVMLYEMLTGRLPFTGSSMGEVLMRHLSEQPDVSGIPEPFARVIAKALEKDPKNRYANIDEMVAEVTDVTEVSESIASFDPSTLARVPRQPDGIGPDRTLTTPPQRPPVPVLDARDEAHGGLPPIPPIPPVLDTRSARRARKLERKARKRQKKLERAARTSSEQAAEQGLPVPRRRWRQLLVALIVLFAAAGGLGIGYGHGQIFAASLLYLLGGLVGTLLAYKLSGRRLPSEYGFHNRLLYAACGFVFMLPGFAAAQAITPGAYPWARLIIPLTATLLIFNWAERIRQGRQQIIRGGTIFWHGLAGAIFAGVGQAGDCALAGAVLSAVLLVLVQAAAAIWPLPAGITAPIIPPPPPRGAGRHGPWRHLGHVYQRATTALETAGARVEEAIDTEVKKHGRKPDTAEREKKPAKQPAPVATYQPSFVGRTANAGLSFLAKLLLLAGLTAALLFSAKLVDINADGTHGFVGQHRVLITEDGVPELDQEIPPAAVFVLILLGSVLLIVARRNDGAAHFVRGFFGCVLAGVAAILATGPFAQTVALFFEGEWDTLRAEPHVQGVFVIGMLLVIALLLLFWPKPVRRDGRPIVI
jgi:serine/threonine protein kinase